MKIIYVMDPICGWCYGNTNNTTALFNEFKDRVAFEVLPGGMWSGSNVRVQSAHMMNYFLKHDAAITERTGVQFGEAYLDFIKTHHDVMLDSEIPSRAIVTISQIAPELVIPFTVETLKARYYYGKDFNLNETYSSILENFNIDQRHFFDHFESAAARITTEDTFKKAATYAQSYPTMLAEKDGQIYLLEQGYATYEELSSRVTQLLQ